MPLDAVLLFPMERHVPLTMFHKPVTMDAPTTILAWQKPPGPRDVQKRAMIPILMLSVLSNMLLVSIIVVVVLENMGLDVDYLQNLLSLNLVVCGPGCFFSNTCLGEAAGYTDCSPVCPTPPEGTACTANYSPIFCQGCEFDNECLAEAAGFTVATDCTSIATPVTMSTMCPAVSDTVACTLVSALWWWKVCCIPTIV